MAHQTRHAIIFVAPFDADTRMVNRATGKHGFGHVAVWGGHVHNGESVVLDSSTEFGVSFRPLREMTRGVPYVSQYLDDRLGSFIFSRAIAKLGCQYDFGGLLSTRVREDAFTCSGLVACSLPVHIEHRCRKFAGKLPVSPNAIARGMFLPRGIQ